MHGKAAKVRETFSNCFKKQHNLELKVVAYTEPGKDELKIIFRKAD